MKLLLICDEGHSTSILMQRVREAVERRGLEMNVACDGFTGGSVETERADVILIAPQVSYLQRDLEAHLERPTAVGLIPRRVFGALDADAILSLGLELHELYGDLREAWGLCEELAPREVLVCCAGGMSSSLLVWYMERAAEAANLHVRIVATGVSRGKFLLGKADCVLIAPQVSFAEPVIQEFNDRHVPVGHIPRMRYGRMDGQWIMEEATRLLEEGGTPPYVMDGPFKRRWDDAVATLERVRSETTARRDAIVKAYGKRKSRR